MIFKGLSEVRDVIITGGVPCLISAFRAEVVSREPFPSTESGTRRGARSQILSSISPNLSFFRVSRGHRARNSGTKALSSFVPALMDYLTASTLA